MFDRVTVSMKETAAAAGGLMLPMSNIGLAYLHVRSYDRAVCLISIYLSKPTSTVVIHYSSLTLKRCY